MEIKQINMIVLVKMCVKNAKCLQYKIKKNDKMPLFFIIVFYFYDFYVFIVNTLI